MDVKMDKKPLLGITMGDPTGIGPEIVAKVLNHDRVYSLCRPLIVGDLEAMRQGLEIAGAPLKINRVEHPKDGIYTPGTMDIYDLRNVKVDQLVHGKPSAMGGEVAYRAIEKVIELAMHKEIDGTITAPISKEALHMAGYKYSGHTEIYAELTGTKDYTMMLAEGDIRVTHVSTHVSLREACNRVKKDRVLQVIRLSYEVCKRLGIKTPRIAVAGLNPHAGENGMFGTEEIDEIIPAIEQAHAKGMNVTGPIPPDTLFSKLKGGMYDIAVAMYHDQGHIPMKVIGFNFCGESTKESTRMLSLSGVNITLGLPIIRISVDHGTAFGKAGKGTASEDSLMQAIEYGCRLCG